MTITKLLFRRPLSPVFNKAPKAQNYKCSSNSDWFYHFATMYFDNAVNMNTQLSKNLWKLLIQYLVLLFTALGEGYSAFMVWNHAHSTWAKIKSKRNPAPGSLSGRRPAISKSLLPGPRGSQQRMECSVKPSLTRSLWFFFVF